MYITSIRVHPIIYLFCCFPLGVLIHVDDPACQLNDLLFVDPKWVFHLFAHLTTRKDSKNSNGILGLEELEKLVRDGSGVVNLTSDLMPQILK